MGSTLRLSHEKVISTRAQALDKTEITAAIAATRDASYLQSVETIRPFGSLDASLEGTKRKKITVDSVLTILDPNTPGKCCGGQQPMLDFKLVLVAATVKKR